MPLPVVGDDDVLVVATHGAVSRGTESLVFGGRVPASEYERMRCPHMEGAFTFPAKYGYCSVGFVEEAGKNAKALRGRRVFCLHPHQDRYVVPAACVTPIPDGTPSGRAVLAPNAETAVNAVWDSKVSLGDRVAVVGGGVVGCLVAYLCGKIPGATVTLYDINDARAPVATALGVRYESAKDATRGDGDNDVVFHCSGTAAGGATALRLAGVEATVVEASWYGDAAPALPLGEGFHAKRLTLRSSQVGGLPVDRRPRWTYGRRLGVALDVCADPALDALLEGSDLAFGGLADALPAVFAGGGLCHRIAYAVPECPPTPPRPNDLGEPRRFVPGMQRIALNTDTEARK